jgi:DNA-binding IclR family transcriptional regulator
MTPPQPIPGTRSVRRALSILRAFSEEKPTWSLTELAAESGLSKATTHRMLSVLGQEDFLVRRSRDGRYQLGPELIVLGLGALKAVDFRAVASHELRFLVGTTGADATLESLVGWEVLILGEEKGRSLLGLDTEIGTKWPAHATATGKVLIADVPEPMPLPPGGLDPLTANTLTSWERWTEELSRVREQGYATNLEELAYGYSSVAAPIRGPAGRAVAALSVGGSTHRITADRIPELAQAVREAAARVSERLGYRGSG